LLWRKNFAKASGKMARATRILGLVVMALNKGVISVESRLYTIWDKIQWLIIFVFMMVFLPQSEL
jgi:hypothetical protein